MKLVKLLLSSIAAVVITVAVTSCASAPKKADCACTPGGATAAAGEHPAGGEHPGGEHPGGGEHPSSTPPAAAAPAAAPEAG